MVVPDSSFSPFEICTCWNQHSDDQIDPGKTTKTRQRVSKRSEFVESTRILQSPPEKKACRNLCGPCRARSLHARQRDTTALVG